MSAVAGADTPGPRKRPRVEDSASPEDDMRTMALLDEEAPPAKRLAPSAPTPPPASEPAPERDPQYYFHDGSFVLRAENTLFKVHQSIMARDGSIFNTMFSLPQGDQPAEGVSDATALVLPGERAAEFRAFLWAMYALPPELLSVHAPGADLDRLVSVAAAAAHYGFKAVETWALDALLEHAARKPCPLLGPEPLPPPPARARLRRVVRLAQDCAHARLLDTLVKLLAGLVPRSLPLAYLCMALADDFDLRTLRGHAYLEIMHKDAVTVFRAPADPDTSEPGTPVPAFWEPGEVDASGRLVITTGQHYRLLAGFHKLTSEWERLRTKPPTFEHAASCGATWHQHGCTQSWLEFWKEKTKADGVLALGVADTIGRLRLIQKEFDRWGSATYMHHDCRQAARRALGDQLHAVEQALPDYFSEP